SSTFFWTGTRPDGFGAFGDGPAAAHAQEATLGEQSPGLGQPRGRHVGDGDIEIDRSARVAVTCVFEQRRPRGGRRDTRAKQQRATAPAGGQVALGSAAVLYHAHGFRAVRKESQE